MTAARIGSNAAIPLRYACAVQDAESAVQA